MHLAQVAAVALAVAMICSEFHPGTIRTTFATNARRTRVFAAKTLVVSATAPGTAALGVLGAVLLGRPSLAGRGLTAELGYRQLPLSAGTLQRAVIGTMLYLVLVALFTVGVSAIVQHSGTAIGMVLTALYGPYLASLLIPMPPHALRLVQDACR